MSEQLFLAVVGEGGGYELYGRFHEHNWTFYSERNESALADLLDEEDQDLVPALTERRIQGTNIHEALRKLGANWMYLYPKYIHPLFAVDVMEYILSLDIEISHKWRQRLTDNSLCVAAKNIKYSKRLVVLSGAGMSVDSGVNDFRSSSGWWHQIDPRVVATVKALEKNYKLFHDFYKARIEELENVIPHEGHIVLSRWEKDGRLQLIATQNVDGLHQLAGNRRVEELHGSIHVYRCHQCNRSFGKEKFINHVSCDCGGPLRPGVVLFGEALPQQTWNTSLRAIEEADVVLVIGTSLQVYPVNQLPYMTEAHLIMINKDATGQEDLFKTVIQGRARDSLLAIDRWLAHV